MSAIQTIASGAGWDFVLIGIEVYRVAGGWAIDAVGHPMGKRWECSLDHWNRYREVYSWAIDR